jgi:hypothetical protein
VKDKLIAAGVKNLREFGYPACDEKNILTDYVYSKFFVSMLKENKGHGKEIDDAIDELLAVCEANAKVKKGSKKRKV